jgi:hypothetical protein
MGKEKSQWKHIEIFFWLGHKKNCCVGNVVKFMADKKRQKTKSGLEEINFYEWKLGGEIMFDFYDSTMFD